MMPASKIPKLWIVRTAIEHVLQMLPLIASGALLLAGCQGRESNTDHRAAAIDCPYPLITVTRPPITTVMPTRIAYTSAQEYLAEALEHIHRHSVRQDRLIDWWAYHDQVLTFAGDPQSFAETYRAVRYALTQLCDGHSFFLEPVAADRLRRGTSAGFGLSVLFPDLIVIEVLTQGPAASLGVAVGNRVELVNGHSPVSLTGQPFVDLGEEPSVRLTVLNSDSEDPIEIEIPRAEFDPNPEPSGRRLPGGLGYIEITNFLGEGEVASQYATSVQRIISSLDQTSPCGWIVDLRRNTGGNLWPMLLGAAPLLGEGWVGSVIDAEGRVIRWILRSHELRLGADSVVAIKGEGYELRERDVPVGVLTSRITGSAGEGVAVALLGRQNTRFFGETTAGQASANRARELRDGAMLFVASAYFADTTGVIFEGGIVPDQQLMLDWEQFGSENDAVLQAAASWLLSHPRCKN